MDEFYSLPDMLSATDEQLHTLVTELVAQLELRPGDRRLLGAIDIVRAVIVARGGGDPAPSLS